MPPPQTVPRIRVDLLESSSLSLSTSNTLDIRNILSQAKLLPNLLTEDLVFDAADDVLCFEDGKLQDIPPLSMGRHPPLFILQSHRARLPFHIRPEAFELGDFCLDEEDICPVLTAPTIPRMKLMLKEQLYVQKWIDALTPDGPPKHIPWTCEKPATERKWIPEGSIFPAAMVKPSSEQRRAGQSRVTDTISFSGSVEQTSHSAEFCALSEVSASINVSLDSYTSVSHALVKFAGVDSGTLRGALKDSPTPHYIVMTSRVPSPPQALLAASQLTGTATSANHGPPLAARRGKSLSSLKVKGGVIEQLEYPDIPTAFLGSPSVWSPQCDAFPVPSFTDHPSMLLNLRSKCAALGSSTHVHEPSRSQFETTQTSLGVDEWAFSSGLSSFDNNHLNSIDNQGPKEVIHDTSVFLPDTFSTPAKRRSLTARLGFATRLHSTPASQSPVKNSCKPPEAPLPPRPAIVSSSTPPHVRGILKKAKSVRFEDMIIKEFKNSPVSPSFGTSSRHPSPLPSVNSSQRPSTPVPTAVNPPSGPVLVKEIPVLGRSNRDKKSAPGSRVPLKRAKANGKLGSAHADGGDVPETFKPNLATTSIKRPCRIAHAKENTCPTVVIQAQSRPQEPAKTDVRRGLEGPAKSRLSVPLRQIFRFR